VFAAWGEPLSMSMAVSVAFRVATGATPLDFENVRRRRRGEKPSAPGRSTR
jgi:hypothetical protein